MPGIQTKLSLPTALVLPLLKSSGSVSSLNSLLYTFLGGIWLVWFAWIEGDFLNIIYFFSRIVDKSLPLVHFLGGCPVVGFHPELPCADHCLQVSLQASLYQLGGF